MTTPSEPPLEGGSDASGVHRLRLDLAYDGGPFRGFAENAGVRTVAGELRAAVERVLGQRIELTCAGRTDAGVHARGQVVSFDVSGRPPAPDSLRKALNSMLGPEIVVAAVAAVPTDFDARFSAMWRTYRYHVLRSVVPDPFRATTSWWVDDELDQEEMQSAAVGLRGEHDFSSFCRRPKSQDPVSLIRRVLDTSWTIEPSEFGPGGELYTFEITATAFCHQMVRSIVGALVAVGRGRRSTSEISSLLEARSREGAPNLAPPHGLVLWEVGYQPWPTVLADGMSPPLLSSAGP